MNYYHVRSKKCAYHMPGFAQSEFEGFKSWNFLDWMFGYVGLGESKVRSHLPNRSRRARRSLRERWAEGGYIYIQIYTYIYIYIHI